MKANHADLALAWGIELPSALSQLWAKPPKLGSRLYSVDAAGDKPHSLAAAIRTLASSSQPPPRGLVPITYVDDRSFACVVCQPLRGEAFGAIGSVVRWHLDDIPVSYQGAVLDTDVEAYVLSLVDELNTWQSAYEGMAKASARYQEDFISKGIRPKTRDLRPFQLACQNVIIGLAAMRHNAAFDGLTVAYWQSCEVPHVATNEGSRALSALMLCDAYQAGGTMEISFAQHPEKRVPAALRRYGRTVGVKLGIEIPGGASISPTEARRLFLAVTPMTAGLREAFCAATDVGMFSVEAGCYSLLSPIWPALELEFILRTSIRASSLVGGGSDVHDREARSSELETARAACLVGTLYRRLNNRDLAVAGDEAGPRMFEDATHGVTWRVIGDAGAVEFSGISPGPLPWQTSTSAPAETLDGRLLVLPRPHPLKVDVEILADLGGDRLSALVIPTGSQPPMDALAMVSPDRLSDLDARVRRNLESSRLARS